MSLSRPEAEAEGSLTFDGFLSFHCKTRADSQSVVSWVTVRNVLYQRVDAFVFKVVTLGEGGVNGE